MPGKIDQELLENFAGHRAGGLLSLRAASSVEYVRERARHKGALVRDVFVDESALVRGGAARAEGFR